MKNSSMKVGLVFILVLVLSVTFSGSIFIQPVLGTGGGGGGDGGDAGGYFYWGPSSPYCMGNEVLSADGSVGFECDTGKYFVYDPIGCPPYPLFLLLQIFGNKDPCIRKIYSQYFATLLNKQFPYYPQGTCGYIGGEATCVYNIPNYPAAPAPPSPTPTTTTQPPAVSPTPPPPCDPDTCTGTCLDVDGDGVTECIASVCGNGIVESGEECDPPLSTASCTVNNKSGIKTCGNNCKFTDGGKCTEVSDAPQLSDFKSFGNPNYLNVFWKASYPSVSRQLSVECYLNCNPQKENCSTAQKCEPFPYIQQPGSGSCTVENPKYLTSKDNFVTCKAYDPSNPSLANWY